MHNMGQPLISTAVSRISWIPSPHLSERLKNPFRLTWLNTVEQKFRLLQLTDSLKAEYVAHQLPGPAGI